MVNLKLNGDDYTIDPQDYKIKLRKYTGDDPLDYDDMDNNSTIFTKTINQLIFEITYLHEQNTIKGGLISALTKRVEDLEGA